MRPARAPRRIDAVNDFYGAPYGFGPGTLFGWDAASVAAIEAANPNLAHLGHDFVLPRTDVAPHLPFPIFGGALMGPYDHNPFEARWFLERGSGS